MSVNRMPRKAMLSRPSPGDFSVSSLQTGDRSQQESLSEASSSSTTDSKGTVRTQVPAVQQPLKEWEADGKELLRWTTKDCERDVAEYRRRLILREATARKEYDPYAHREHREHSDWAATMHVTNGIMNFGTFFITQNFLNMGMAIAVVMVITLAVLSSYCIYMALRNEYAICRMLRESWLGLPRMVEYACRHGPAILSWSAPCFRYFVYVCIVLRSMATSATYCRLLGQFLKDVLDVHFSTEVRMFVLISLPLLILVNIVFNMKLLLVESIGKNLLTCVGMVLLMIILFHENQPPNVKVNIADTDVWTFAHFVNGTLFALNNVPLVQYIERNMRNPQNMLGVCGVFSRSMVFITFVTLVIAISSYSYLGQDMVLFMPMKFSHSELRTILIIIHIVGCFLSFPITNIVAYDIIWQMNLKNALRDYPKILQCVVGAVVRLVLVLISIVFALTMPNYFIWERLTLSLTVPMLVLAFPAMIEMCLCWEMKNFGRFHYALFKDVVMILIAMCCCVFGCLDLVKHAKNNKELYFVE